MASPLWLAAPLWVQLSAENWGKAAGLPLGANACGDASAHTTMKALKMPFFRWPAPACLLAARRLSE